MLAITVAPTTIMIPTPEVSIVSITSVQTTVEIKMQSPLFVFTSDYMFSPLIIRSAGTNVFNGSSTLDSKFLGIHCDGLSTSKLSAGVVRGHDVTPRWYQLHLASGVFSTYYATKLVDWLTSVKAAGMETIYTVYGCPKWAAARPTEALDMYGGWYDYDNHLDVTTEGGMSEPSNMANLSEFITWLMTNYGDKIDYLEVWNEPKYVVDHSSFFSGTPSKLAEMARTINLAAKAIKPTIKIIGVSATGCTWQPTMSAYNGTYQNNGFDITNFFLSASDNNGGHGKDWIDILSFHTYGAAGNDYSKLTSMSTWVNQIQIANAINLPFWNTEWGFIDPSLSTYSLADAEKVRLVIRYALYNFITGAQRTQFYAYNSPAMGWAQAVDGDVFWNEWVQRLNGSTITCINKLKSGELACVIDGIEYLL